MSTLNVRLNITLPKNLVHLVDQMTGERQRSKFIAEAIELKVKQIRREMLEKKLAEGYEACINESIHIASEFETSDLEGWDDY